MILLASLLSLAAQDAVQPANRARMYPLEWEDAAKFAGMAPCSTRSVGIDFAKTHSDLRWGYLRGDEDFRYAYVASVQIYSDAPIDRKIHAGLSAYANFGASFPSSPRVLRLATDRLGLAREVRSIVVLIVSDQPIDAIECEAFATQ